MSFVFILQVLFSYISIVKEAEMAQVGSLIFVVPILNKEGGMA